MSKNSKNIEIGGTMESMQRILHALRYCGIEEEYLLGDILDIKYLFVPNNGDSCIIGGFETLVHTTRENMVQCIEVNIAIHQKPSWKCLRCIPGDCLSGGPKWFLVDNVDNYDKLIQGNMVFFHKDDGKNTDIDTLINKTVLDFSKKGHSISEVLLKKIYINKSLINKLLQFPLFSFHYKHGIITSRVQNILISKEKINFDHSVDDILSLMENIYLGKGFICRIMRFLIFCFYDKHGIISNKLQNILDSRAKNNEYFLSINLFLSTNMNFKCVRKSLSKISSCWEILSTYGSGRKIYEGKMMIN